MNNALLLLAFPLTAVFLIPVGTVFFKGFGRFLSMLSYLAGIVYGIYLFPSILAGSKTVIVGNWAPPFGINLFISPFSLGLVILIFSAAFIIMVTDLQNKGKSGQYYLLYTLFVMASAGMVLTGDIFNLFVFLEIGGIASFALIAAGASPMGSAGSLRYLIQAQITSLSMLAGIILIYSASGVLNIAVLAQFKTFNPAFAFLALVLLLFPFMLESKLFPLHTWVGGAYLGADHPFAASMSGIAATAAGAVMLRIVLTLANPQSGFGTAGKSIQTMLIILGGITVLIGEGAAFTEKNFKKVLGYSSAGQMGIIAVGIGMATKEALAGVLFLILTHTAAKILLFSVAGLFSKVSGKEKWADMKGIGRIYPLPAALFAAGAMALFGIPMFSGFWGKLYILKSAFALGGLAYAGAGAILIGTIFEGIYFMKISHTFFEKGDFSRERKHYPFFGIPALFLAAVLLAPGLFPSLISPWVQASVKELLNPISGYVHIILTSGGAM